MLYKTTVPFIRQEVEGVKTVALVEFTTNRKLSQKACMSALIEIITYWVKETVEGKTAYTNSMEDFNIGDYSLHETQIHDQTPHSMYTRRGIQDINILYNGEVAGTELYDRHLVDSSKL